LSHRAVWTTGGAAIRSRSTRRVRGGRRRRQRPRSPWRVRPLSPALGARDRSAKAGGLCPATTSGGRPLEGRGCASIPAKSAKCPWYSGCSSYQSACIASRNSSVTAPRWAKLAPNAAKLSFEVAGANSEYCPPA
jgi:hypothetical protein